MLYGPVQNICKIKFMLKFLNRNTYKHMYIILKYDVNHGFLLK